MQQAYELQIAMGSIVFGSRKFWTENIMKLTHWPLGDLIEFLDKWFSSHI